MPAPSIYTSDVVHPTMSNIVLAHAPQTVDKVDIQCPDLLTPIGGLIGDQLCRQDMGIGPPSTHDAFLAEPPGLELVSVLWQLRLHGPCLQQRRWRHWAKGLTGPRHLQDLHDSGNAADGARNQAVMSARTASCISSLSQLVPANRFYT